VLTSFVARICAAAASVVRKARRVFKEATRPLPLLTGLVTDLTRSRKELLAENALLRQQLIVVRRQVERPRLLRHERAVMVALAAMTRTWRETVLLVKPDTVLRWHRHGFRLFWRWRSRCRRPEPRLAQETIQLIRRMALENRLWGAERIRGELLKLGMRVSKRSIQKYMRAARGPRPWGQDWATFLRNHAEQIWACDFVQTYDVWFRPIFALFIVNLGSREVVHVGVTRAPTSRWTANRLRQLTAHRASVRFVIRDNDDKYGGEFDRVAEGANIEVIHTAVKAPLMNSVCERFVGSVRREGLDHVLVLSTRHLQSVLDEFCFHYFNRSRAHQGLGQRVPVPAPVQTCSDAGRVVARPVPGGLHHDYQVAA
jgi:putative transposase